MTVNLQVATSSEDTLSKGWSGTITMWWVGVLKRTNWASATVVSPDDDGNIKVKWQKRISDADYDGGDAPAIKMGVDNDSGSKVSYYVVLMVDTGSGDTASEPREVRAPVVIAEAD